MSCRDLNGDRVTLVLLPIPFLATFVPRCTHIAGEINTLFRAYLCEGYTMLLVALMPPDAQKLGRVWPVIESSVPNPFFFLLSYFCFILLFICLPKSTDTRQKTILLARGKQDPKRHSLTFAPSSASIQNYQLAMLLLFRSWENLTERLPSYHDTVTWTCVQNISHACCFAIRHNDVNILLLYEDYFMKAIFLLSNLESSSGKEALWPSLFFGWATIGLCSVFTWKASQPEKSQSNLRLRWWERPAHCCPLPLLDPFVSILELYKFLPEQTRLL